MLRQSHPDPELLDRLRAGLLDDRPREKAQLEAHLATCDSCSTQQSAWTQITTSSIPAALGPEHVHQALREARGRALQAPQTTRHGSGLVPFAAAALLLIAVSAGLWNDQPDPAYGTRESATVAQSVPDIYEDLDFYLWLANQNETDTEDSDGNPNST